MHIGRDRSRRIAKLFRIGGNSLERVFKNYAEESQSSERMISSPVSFQSHRTSLSLLEQFFSGCWESLGGRFFAHLTEMDREGEREREKV